MNFALFWSRKIKMTSKKGITFLLVKYIFWAAKQGD